MGEPAWSGLGAAQARGRACVICAHRLSIEQAVVVGRCSTGASVVACPGVCAARAVSLGEFRAAVVRVGGGGQR